MSERLSQWTHDQDGQTREWYRRAIEERVATQAYDLLRDGDWVLIEDGECEAEHLLLLREHLRVVDLKALASGETVDVLEYLSSLNRELPLCWQTLRVAETIFPTHQAGNITQSERYTRILVRLALQVDRQLTNALLTGHIDRGKASQLRQQLGIEKYQDVPLPDTDTKDVPAAVTYLGPEAIELVVIRNELIKLLLEPMADMGDREIVLWANTLEVHRQRVIAFARSLVRADADFESVAPLFDACEITPDPDVVK